MDWLNKIFDIHKLPFRIIFLFAFVTSVIIGNPFNIVAKLDIAEFKIKYGAYLGMASLLFSSLVVINILIELFRKISHMVSNHRFKKEIIGYLKDLDYAEQAVLREFYLQGVHNIKLPIDNPVVAGLLNKRIIYCSSRNGYRYLCGTVFPISLNSIAQQHINNHAQLIRISELEDAEWLKNNRPDFIYTIDRYDALLRH